MGFILALVVVVIVFLALVKAIAFTETLNEICLLLLAVAVLLGGGFGVVQGWFKR